MAGHHWDTLDHHSPPACHAIPSPGPKPAAVPSCQPQARERRSSKCNQLSTLGVTGVVTALPVQAGVPQKAARQSWAGSEPPCQRRREASSRWAHVLLKKKRSFLHQMEHFLLNNTPILICTKKIAPCISTSCICHLLLPAPTTWAAPWLPDRHMACAKPCPVLSEMGRRKTSHRQCPALGAGASSISAEPHQHQASILCHQ